MRKVISFTVAVIICLIIMGCAVYNYGGENGMRMKNPMVGVGGAAEIESSLGFTMDAPDGAENAAYWVISETTGQIDFNLDGIRWCYRGSERFSGVELHGMYYTQVGMENVELENTKVFISDLGNGGLVAEWNLGGANRSLSGGASASRDALLETVSRLIRGN